jgi:2-keto-4-pentenoate hydratase
MSDARTQAFITARRNRDIIGFEYAPASLEDAFDISAATIRALNEKVGGWKVGYAPDGRAVASPMYASGFLSSGGIWASKKDRPMIPEIEIAVRLAQDLPKREKPYTREDIENAASDYLIGIELIERRIPMQSIPFPMNLADDLGNVGYVTGPSTKDFRKLDLPNLMCKFRMAGEIVTERRGGHPKGDPLLPMIDWANQQCDDLGGMRAGQIVTLGSLTPLVIMPGPGLIEAEIEGIGAITLTVK